MKNIVIRSGLSPLDDIDINRILCMNLLGYNVGNLIYAYSIYRLLQTSEEGTLYADEYRLNNRSVKRFNETCDMYIIPLADTFREDQISYLEKTSAFIQKLDMPCIVVGVGIRADLNDTYDHSYPFDDAVKLFMNTVLEKSGMVGVRGENTAKYLTYLGYQEDKDFMVIGCPSLFMHGAEIPEYEPVDVSKISKISFNSNILSDPKFHYLTTNLMKKYPDHVFLPQRVDELKTLYLGSEYKTVRDGEGYPHHLTDRIYQEDKVKFFLNAKSWMNYLSTMDLSIGGRLHGNVAALQAGIPAIWVPHDSRMQELINYHHLPCLKVEDIKEDMTLEEIFEKVDFDSIRKYHRENFERFKKFLDYNDIDHIYKNQDVVKEAPLDIMMERKGLPGAVVSAKELSKEELAARWQDLYDAQTARRNTIIDERIEDIQFWKGRYEEKRVALNELKKQHSALERDFHRLDHSRIKEDLQLVSKKIGNKMTGRKQENFEIMIQIRENNRGKSEDKPEDKAEE